MYRYICCVFVIKTTVALGLVLFSLNLCAQAQIDTLRIREKLDSALTLYHQGRPADAYAVALDVHLLTDSITLPKWHAHTHTYLGNFAYALAKYPEAIMHHHYARISYLQNGDLQRSATSLNNIGTVLQNIRQFELALKTHLKALAIVEKSNNLERLSMIYTNIGNDYEELEKFEIALAYHKKALAIDSATQNQTGLSADYVNIGALLGHLGDYRSAIQYHKNSLFIDSINDDAVGMANAYNNLAYSYLHLNALDSATYFAHLGKKLAHQYADAEIIRRGHKILSEIHLKRNRHDSAFFYQRLLEKTEKRLDMGRQFDKAIELHIYLMNYPQAQVEIPAQSSNTDVHGQGFYILLGALILLTVLVLTLAVLVLLNKL